MSSDTKMSGLGEQGDREKGHEMELHKAGEQNLTTKQS